MPDTQGNETLTERIALLSRQLKSHLNNWPKVRCI